MACKILLRQFLVVFLGDLWVDHLMAVCIVVVCIIIIIINELIMVP